MCECEITLTPTLQPSFVTVEEEEQRKSSNTLAA